MSKSFWQEVLGFTLPPDDRAMLLKELSYVFDCFGRHDWCSVFGIEDWQWHTPSPLTRDNPVTTVTNHIVETYLAPFRMEFNLFNFI